MDGGAGGTGSDDGMGDDMGTEDGPNPKRGGDSVDHDVGTPATGPTLVEQVSH